jgi:hypothetical protein
MQREAAGLLRTLHLGTARTVLVDHQWLNRWVDARLLLISQVLAAQKPAFDCAASIARLKEELHSRLRGQSLMVSWIHGDFWPGNLLLGEDGTTLTGIVDWDKASQDELPLHDLLNLLLYTRKLTLLHGAADIVAAVTGGVDWTTHERMLLRELEWALPVEQVGERALVVLYWLREVTETLAVIPSYARDRQYIAENIVAILQRV